MTTFSRPPGRYDAPRTLPRPVLVGGAVTALLLMVVLAYLAFDRFSASKVSFALLSYSVVDERTVDVRFQVMKEPGTTVLCLVRARDSDNVEVGSERVRFEPTESGALIRDLRLATTARAALGEVLRCDKVDGPTTDGTSP